MGKYQTKPQHDKRYETIAAAEGEMCLVCYIEKGRRNGPPKTRLQIDHADNKRTNWAWSNLHLLCAKHNSSFRGRDHSSLLRAYGDQLKREREREGKPTWESTLANELDFDNASPELKLNRIYWPKWVKKATQMVQAEAAVEKKRLIATCGLASGASKQTSTNYLDQQIHADQGVFSEFTDGDGNKMVKMRELAIKNPFSGKTPRAKKAAQ